ncbi:hypothetical protein C0J52_25127, partial [Blattella germanica]
LSWRIEPNYFCFITDQKGKLFVKFELLRCKGIDRRGSSRGERQPLTYMIMHGNPFCMSLCRNPPAIFLQIS